MRADGCLHAQDEPGDNLVSRGMYYMMKKRLEISGRRMIQGKRYGIDPIKVRGGGSPQHVQFISSFFFRAFFFSLTCSLLLLEMETRWRLIKAT